MSMFRKNLGLFMIFIGLIVGFSNPVSAAIFSIDTVDGDWVNGVPSANVTIHNDLAGGLNTARWGIGSSQSGYDFDETTTPFNAVSDGTAFVLGTFTHLNFPISAGTSITGIDLNLTLADIGIFNINTTFNFQHNETPNSTGGPADNDIVTISNPIVNQLFTSGGSNYYFNLIGFSQDGGNTIASTFSTVEGQRNTASLYARITEAPISVPEPSSLLLLGAGLIGTGIMRKRAKK